VLVVGDSVPSALTYMPGLETKISAGYQVRFDFQVCRRIATPGCSYGRSVPSSALSVVASSDHPAVLVVDVGYNDDPTQYGRQMEQLIRTAKAVGVKQIVWVNLHESEPSFSAINVVIRSEASRYPFVQIADWNAWSAGKPWFRSDGLHLTDAGAEGLALMLRVYVVSAARAASS
jgi:hypothetical protein